MSDQDSAGPSYRSVLGIKNFRLLALGTATSEIGDWLYNIALLVYVYDATGSPGWVGVATIGRLLPYALLSPVGGVLADRFERVRVMLVSNLVRFVIFAGMTAAVALQASVPVVVVLAALATAAGAPYRPASSALLPALVGESRLAPAMAFLSTLFSVALVAGPALGAAVLAFGPPALAFGINAATFAVSSAFLRAITVRSAGVGGAAEAPPTPWRMFADGIRAVRDTPYVTVVTLLCFVGALGYGAETVLLVLYAEQQLGVGADGYGLLVAAAGAGGVVAGVFGARLVGRPTVAVVTTVSCGLAGAGLLLYAGTSALSVAIAIAAVTGAAMVVADVVTDVAITRAAEGSVLGRIYGAIEGVAVAGTVLGALIAPALTSVLGVRPALVVVGAVTTVVTLATFPRLRQLDRAAAPAVGARSARLRTLSGVAVFEGAGAPAMEQLAESAAEVTVWADLDVVTQGQPADAFYVVVDGTLTVLLSSDGADPEPVRTLGAGDWFGEIGLLERVPRTATVRSTTPCLLLRVGGEGFVEALTAHPGMYGPLWAGATARLAHTHPAWTSGPGQPAA